MAYVGNVPARSFISFERQVFTIVNSQTAYTLSHSVTNENDIRLVINNIVQEPGSGKAYTASGTTLTLSAALTNGTDEMYCVFLGRAVGTVNAPVGSVGTSQLAADAVTNAKIADDAISDEQLDPTAITGQTAETSIADDDLILLSDTSASAALKKMTRANFVSGIGGTNTPAFEATLGSNQAPSNDVNTLVVFDSERFDTASAYNTSDGKFTPQTAGKYFVYGSIAGQSTVDSGNLYKTTAMIYFNGSETRTEDIIGESGSSVQNARMSVSTYGIFTFNGSSDYVQLYANIQTHTGGNVEIQSNLIRTYFGAYKIIE